MSRGRFRSTPPVRTAVGGAWPTMLQRFKNELEASYEDCGDVFQNQIRKFGDNLLGRMTSRQIPQNKACGNSRILDSRFPFEDIRGTNNPILPK